jgi:CMP-N,N'-diacetyllegionaminic acid synthase
MKKKILWLIAARSGSKSIPHKNIKLLGEHPLLSYRINSVLNSNNKYDLWISTDSPKYALIAENYGAEVPFIRPEELSLDNSSSMDVVLHAMEYANKEGREYDCIGLLEPTSPFIKSRDIDKAVNLLLDNEEASSIVAVKESRPHKIFIQNDSKYLVELSENLNEINNLTRQAFEKEITPSGGFYISKWDVFLQKKTFYTSQTLSYEVDEISGLEIDELIDWDFAEFIIKNKKDESSE